jgi:DedD protein
MRLPFLRPKDDSAQPMPGPALRRTAARGTTPAVADETTAVEQARTQARRRLIGALVLLAAGVVGFPLLFETQPRPLAPGLAPGGVAAPVEAARSDAKSDARNDARTDAPAATGRVASGPVTALPGAASAALGATGGAAGGGVAGGVVAAGAVAAAAAAAIAAPASAAKAQAQVQAPKAEPKAVEPKPVEAKKAETKTAEAPKLETPKPDATAAAPRYVVQVGAFNDATRMRDARNKVEKLGFKTYTSEVNSSTGRRTRVRLGPFATKKEADAAAAKVKTVGLPADVLTL